MEWEYAARAGSTIQFHFGNNESQMCRYANFGDVTAGREGVPCSDNVTQLAGLVPKLPTQGSVKDMPGLAGLAQFRPMMVRTGAAAADRCFLA